MKIILKSIILILILIPLFFGSILLFHKGELEYTQDIEVNTNIEKANTMFEDIYNMKKYMPETKDIVLISGEDKKEGAKYKIMISAGNESIEMLGTLTNNNLPQNLTMIYEMPGVINTMEQQHEKIDDNKTLIINKQKFQFSGFMKILAFFEPEGFNMEAFQERSNTYLNSFKYFAETESY